VSTFGGPFTRLARPKTALLLDILQYIQTSEVGGDIAMVPVGVVASGFGVPDLRGGHRADAMLEASGRFAIVLLPINSLEPPVDGCRESKTQWQER
jgi:hypothetical protein